MRLRGAKTELEDAGEDVDGMAESTSQLQAKLLALSHGKVDIMLDADTFKNTTQILREMSKAWGDMTDIEQAAALELMGGKRQANTLAAILENFDIVENVIETSLDAEGSAMAENEKYLDSIQGRVDVFNNSMETLWMNAINSDAAKFFVNLGNAIIKITDNVGLLKVAISSFLAYKAFKSNSVLGGLFAGGEGYGGVTFNNNSFMGKTANKLFKNSQYATVNGMAANQVPNANVDSMAIAQKTQGNAASTAAGQNETYTSSLNNIGTAAGTAATNVNNLGTAQSNQGAAASGGQTGNVMYATSEQAVGTSGATAATGVDALTGATATQGSQAGTTTGQNTGLAASETAVGVAATGASIGVRMLNAALTMGIGLLVGFAIEGIVNGLDALIVTSEEAAEAAREAESAIKSLNDEFKSDTKTVSDYAARFADLAQGVDMLTGKNLSLTTDDYEEFLDISNKLADVFPTLNRNYDENGNAIVKLNGDANTMVKSLENLLDVQRQLANQKIAEELPDLYNGVHNKSESYNATLSMLEGKRDAYIKQLNNLPNFIDGGLLQVDGVSDLNALSSLEEDLINMFDELNLTYEYLSNETDKDGNVVGFNYRILDFIDGSKSDKEIAVIQDKIADIYSKAINDINGQIPNIVAQNKANWGSLLSGITSWLSTDSSYQVLNDDMQSVVQQMVNNIDFSKLDGVDTWEDMQAYIQTNIISKIQSATPAVQNAFSQLFKISTKDISTRDYIGDIKKKAQEIADSSDFTYEEVLKNTGYEDIIKQYETSAQNILAVLDDSIPKHYEKYKEGTALHFHAIDQYGIQLDELRKKIYSLSPDDMARAFDIIKKYGIKTWDELQKALENKTFDVVFDYDKEQEGMNGLLTAIEESMSATGLSSESIENLKARYQDLESYDPARLFEETTNGIHLNSKALRELEQEYKEYNKEVIDNKLDGLVEQYNNLTDQIEDCSDAYKRASLYSQRQNILDQINDTATLAAKYAGLTSAYNEWQNAQSGGNERDMYEGIISGKEELEEELSRGWLDDSTRQYLELLSGEDLSTANYDKLLNVYKQLHKQVNKSGYDVFDFFTTDKDGNSTTNGIFNFLDAVKVAQKEVGKEWVKIGKDGGYIFDFGEGGDKAVAEALGISEELVQIILRAAQDAGFEVNLDTAYSQLADFKDEVGTVNDRLKDLEATDYTFNITSTDINDLDTQITEAEDAIENLYNEDGTLKLNVDDKDVEDAKTLLATLIYQKQTLDESIILYIDTTNADTSVEQTVKKLQSYKAIFNEYEVNLALGNDTTELEAQMRAIIDGLTDEEKRVLIGMGLNLNDVGTIKDQISNLSQADKDTLVELGIDLDAEPQDIIDKINALVPEDKAKVIGLGIDINATPAEIIEQINNVTSGVLISVGLDETLVNDFKNADHTADGEVIWKNNLEEVTSWMNDSSKRQAKGIITWYNKTTNLSWPGSADGTAHVSGTAYAGGSWGAENTETSLVGELGPEILVRNGRWTTVGENGAEFTQVKKGDIIFNHKQTESLLKNGYVTGRGKAYASGTAFSDGAGPGRYTVTSAYIEGGGKDRLDDAADDFAETIDWITIRLEELDETISLLNAQLENATSVAAKNSKIDEIIAKNKEKMANLEAGADYYESYINKFWNKIPAQYQKAAQNGAIAITDFAGEASEEVVEAIQSYRDYVQKAADLRQQKEEEISEIRNLTIQKIDNFQSYGSAKTAIEDAQTERLQNRVNLDETSGLITSSAYYEEMMKNSGEKIEYWTPVLKDMQTAFDEAVQNGTIVRGTTEWYEQLAKLYEVQSEIDTATIELEEFQNAINDIYWDNFDQLINRLDYLKDETQSLIDLMDHEDMVITPETDEGWNADQVEWTKEGLASLGLYAQQMEIAEYESKQYAEAIDDLTKDYKKGLYSENEYYEKLNELTQAQYDCIESYYDAQDAIKDLQSARVDEIKNGIEKQVDAYSELIEKQKEALDSEKDLYDFQKSTMEQQKNISKIERQLAALANDNSMSAIAKRKQLEAELAEAQYELQDSYYNRSVEDKQNALDKELEDFQKEKDAEIEKWDKYLENIEVLVAESLGIVQANATEIGQTLTDKANEYNLTVSDAILKPWESGSLAVSDYQTTFDTAMSSTMDQLDALKSKWQEVIDKMTEVGNTNVTAINKENANYAAATKQEETKQATQSNTNKTTASTPQYSTYTVQKGDTLYDIAKAKLGNSSRWREIYDLNKSIIGSNPNLIYPGQKFKIPKYAKGTTGVKNSQLSLIDELGEELVLHASGGKLAFLSKGSAVIPHDISENLMKIGSLDPSDVLSRNTPKVGLHAAIHNTEVNITMDIAEVVHIDEVTQDTIPDLTKAVRKEMDSYMLKVNNAIRSKVR